MRRWLAFLQLLAGAYTFGFLLWEASQSRWTRWQMCGLAMLAGVVGGVVIVGAVLRLISYVQPREEK